MPSIGIFGGTFDPPHIAHLILAAEARAQLGLHRLLWVLTPDPPHKHGQPLTPLENRLDMVRVAIAGDPDFELSTVEIDRPGPHYALDTLMLLAEQNPGSQLTYLMGGDSLRDLPTWHRPVDFIKACQTIGVVRRPGASIDLESLERFLPGLRSKVRFIQTPLLDIASKSIRQRIAAALPFRYFLAPGVYQYILNRHLYLQDHLG